ncbi:hypothetical protein Tco_0980339 [Tanacetum coccineum]
MYRIQKSQRSSNSTASSGSNPGMFQEMLKQQYELERKMKQDVLERESRARVDLLESQKIAEDMRVLTMDTSSLDPMNAAIIFWCQLLPHECGAVGFLVPLGKSADVAALFPNGTTVPSALRPQYVDREKSLSRPLPPTAIVEQKKDDNTKGKKLQATKHDGYSALSISAVASNSISLQTTFLPAAAATRTDFAVAVIPFHIPLHPFHISFFIFNMSSFSSTFGSEPQLISQSQNFPWFNPT